MNDPASKARSALEAIDAFTASIPDADTTTNGETLPLTQARAKIGKLVRATAMKRERTAITEHGHRAALLVHPEDWDSLIDALAAARSALAVISGEQAELVPHDEAKSAVFGEAYQA